MKVRLDNNSPEVWIDIVPENEMECIALRMFNQLNDPEDGLNINIFTSCEEEEVTNEIS